MRDVTVDEMFGWKENIGIEAYKAFGKRGCLVNPKTYEEIKKRSNVQVPKETIWDYLGMKPFNSLTIHQHDDIPDGILRPYEVVYVPAGEEGA